LTRRGVVDQPVVFLGRPFADARAATLQDEAQAQAARQDVHRAPAIATRSRPIIATPKPMKAMMQAWRKSSSLTRIFVEFLRMVENSNLPF
jgi:hypothetical protein